MRGHQAVSGLLEKTICKRKSIGKGESRDEKNCGD